MSVLTATEVNELLRLLWPSTNGQSDDAQRWYQQGFQFQALQGFCLGLVQAHGGPCGVLAAVQAEILRLFLFVHRNEALSETELRRLLDGDKSDTDEAARQRLLAEAMASLLLQCADAVEEDGGRVVRAVVQDATASTEGNAAVYKEHILPVSATETGAPPDELVALLLREMPAFCSPHGVINFTFSVLRTKSVVTVREEMDDPTNALTGAFGHCTQELLNLLLTGRAVSNVFDGSVPMGDTGLYLHGVSRRARIGYLTQLEALRYCRVGSYYKSPQFPVWVIGSSSHFSMGFALNARVCEESASAQLFQRVQRVFKAFDSMETGFMQMASLADSLKQLGVAPEILANEYWMARLLDRLEISSGAGIVLWDEYWKVISVLLHTSDFELALSGKYEASISTETQSRLQRSDSDLAPLKMPAQQDEDRSAADNGVDGAAVEVHHVANIVLGTDDITEVVDGHAIGLWLAIGPSVTYDLFFAVFAPLVVLVYFIHSFKFDRAAFMTRIESIHDRQTAPRTYAEWTDPEDTTSRLAELAVSGELRIVQIINRALPQLPIELQNCHHLLQLILIYTKTEELPAWMAEFSELEYL
ncbi:hypothetical protein BBJ29_006462 [Phytophthora kernoviae]|uniref:Deubiquitinating enzyme MINDY-3/4 conserved domain-containing protein n=1 Tax=Phytophthora kernoviae TaxID=325452 RepID=A0A3F2RU49_9STRA|nr:hypothetical protein BBJ29_006462 [Phytophthora kernoviae]RLN63786.1 hypothetical protein BBP00_00003869 [Phytophthora kernoviae]